MAIDPLLRQIDHCPRLRGLALPGSNEVKVMAYADDVTLFTRNTEDLIALHDLYNQ